MATASENAAQIQTVFQAFERGDVPFILDQLAEGVRFESHLDPSVPWSGEFAGKSGAVQFFTALGGAVEVTGHPVDRVIAEGDTVVATGQVSFNVRATGVTGKSSWVYVWTLADGEITRYEQFNDAGLADAFR